MGVIASIEGPSGPKLLDCRRSLNVVPKVWPDFHRTIDISYLIIEFKKTDTDTLSSVYQLGMAMSSTIHQLKALGIMGPSHPVFGILVESTIATVYVGWMETDTKAKVSNFAIKAEFH